MERSIKEIIEALSQPLDRNLLKTKKVKGVEITFIQWVTAVRALDEIAPGWSSEVRNVTQIGSRAVVVVRLSIPCIEGIVWREAVGQEDDWDEAEEKRYGDPTSNAEAMAFKRAAAKFGLGLYLYDKDSPKQTPAAARTARDSVNPDAKWTTASINGQIYEITMMGKTIRCDCGRATTLAERNLCEHMMAISKSNGPKPEPINYGPVPQSEEEDAAYEEKVRATIHESMGLELPANTKV